MNNIREIFPEWLENGMFSSVFLQEKNNIYYLLEKIEENNCFYFNKLYETSSLIEMNKIIDTGKQYQKELKELTITNIPVSCVQKQNNISFFYKKDDINYEVFLMDKNVKCGKKLCEPCDFLTYLTLGKMVLHGSSFLDMEYRGKGFGLTMYDLMDKNSGLEMIPHGYPFELNLSNSGRKFWSSRNKHKPVISYNREYYDKIKKILNMNQDLENTHLQISKQNFEYQIKDIMTTLLTALKYNLDINIAKDKDNNILNISCFELFPNNPNVIIETMNVMDAKDFFIDKINNKTSLKDFDYGELNEYRDNLFKQEYILK
jgi:hypothetical protein